MAAVDLRRTIPSVDDADTLERERRSDLLKLRHMYDQLREFEAAIATFGPILADPAKISEHSRAASILETAERGKEAQEKAINKCLEVLDLRDKRDEILHELASLDD